MPSNHDMEIIREQVTSGIEILDAHFGNREWVNRINFGKLDMSSCTECVLGQVFGEYGDGLDTLDVDGTRHGYSLPYGCDGDKDDLYKTEGIEWYKQLFVVAPPEFKTEIPVTVTFQTTITLTDEELGRAYRQAIDYGYTLEDYIRETFGEWVVYLQDPLDPEDDVCVGGSFPEHYMAMQCAENHSEEHGNPIEEYSIEWEVTV